MSCLEMRCIPRARRGDAAEGGRNSSLSFVETGAMSMCEGRGRGSVEGRGGLFIAVCWSGASSAPSMRDEKWALQFSGIVGSCSVRGERKLGGMHCPACALSSRVPTKMASCYLARSVLFIICTANSRKCTRRSIYRIEPTRPIRPVQGEIQLVGVSWSGSLKNSLASISTNAQEVVVQQSQRFVAW